MLSIKADRVWQGLLLLWLPSIAAQAAVETVTLNGKTYEVETQDGRPIAAATVDVQVTELFALAEDAPRPGVLEWFWSARVSRPGPFKVTATTPLDETVAMDYVVAVVDGETKGHFLNSARYPTVWAWLDDDTTSWLPFVLTFEDEQGDTFQVTQWVRFDVADKQALKERARAAKESAAEASSTASQTPSPLGARTDKASVYVLRSSGRRAPARIEGLMGQLSGQHSVFVDDAPVASLPRLSYVVLELEPGWHLLWGDTESEWLEFNAGSTYFLGIGEGLGQNGAAMWLVGAPADIQPTITGRGLERVVPSEESLTELRSEIDKYPRVRSRAGDPPISTQPVDVESVTHSEQRPGGPPYEFTKERRGALAVSDTGLSFRAAEVQLDIDKANVLAVHVVGTQIGIRFRAEGALRTVFFSARNTRDHNRLALATQNLWGATGER